MSNRRTRLRLTVQATTLVGSSFILGAAAITSAASAKSNIAVQPAKSPASAGAVKAHWENPPDKFALTLPCTDTDYIPKTGLCHGTGSGHADLTGTWMGTTVYEYGFATTPANVSQLSIIETFTGTINGCGTGSMSYRLFGTLSATGKINSNGRPWKASDPARSLQRQGTEQPSGPTTPTSPKPVTSQASCDALERRPHNRPPTHQPTARLASDAAATQSGWRHPRR